MASGSNAPFSGEFKDLENVPKLPKGISAEQILEQNSDVVRQVAEARHQAGLSQVNADGGFFDSFVDETKISSKTKFTVLDATNQNIQVIVGPESFSGGATFTGTPNTINTDIQLKLKSFISSFTVATQNNNQDVTVSIKGGSGNVLVSKTITVPNAFEDVKVSFSKSEYSRIPDNETLTVETSSSQDLRAGSGDFQGKLFDVNSQDFPRHNVGGEYVEVTPLNGGSGTLTEQQFTFTDTQGNSFSPSKVGLFPDQNLNGQSITYDLKDSNGNVVKTFNQSDLNQLVDVSTTDTTFQVEANFSSDGSETPELEFLDVRGV